MSASIITVLIILIILGSIAAIAVGQAREKAKIAKSRKINNLQDGFRRLQKLLSDLPPQYLINELRMVVLHRAEEILGELKPYNVDPDIDNKLNTIKENIKLIHDNKFKLPPRPITSEVQGKEARQLMETLIKFIETQNSRKRIDTATAKKYINYALYQICQSKADFFKDKAIAAEKNQKPRMGIHHYHNAISELKKVKNNSLAIKSIKTYQLKIKALEEIAEANNNALKEASDKKVEGSAEWDKFMEKDDKWKKKNAYDD